MAWASSVPGVVGALVGLFRAADGLAAPVAVRDGPTVTGSSARDVVVVGWYGMEADELAVEGDGVTEGLAGLPDREQYVVRCAAISSVGTADIAAARARAYELFAACGAALAAGPRLGGLVMRASIGTSSLRQQPNADKGITVIVEFAVQIDAYTGR